MVTLRHLNGILKYACQRRPSVSQELRWIHSQSTSPSSEGLTQVRHPSLTYLPSFLNDSEQRTLLSAALALLDAPLQLSAKARKRSKAWVKEHPEWVPGGFKDDEAYLYESSHRDGVIRGYREMLVRGGWLHTNQEELCNTLQRLYRLIPQPQLDPLQSSKWEKAQEGGNDLVVQSEECRQLISLPSREREDQSRIAVKGGLDYKGTDPPGHISAHLLHLASYGSIQPHVDSLDSFGDTILGVSLGSRRIMRFTKKSLNPETAEEFNLPMDVEGIESFDILLEPGSVYITRDFLRTHYSHELLLRGELGGEEVEGGQRLSLMLRVSPFLLWSHGFILSLAEMRYGWYCSQIGQVKPSFKFDRLTLLPGWSVKLGLARVFIQNIRYPVGLIVCSRRASDF